MKILITGGAGFIGSAVIRNLIQNTDDRVVNVDKLTYAGNLGTLEEVSSSRRYSFEKVDICNHGEMRRIFQQYKPDAVMHLAAESHVDRSIDGPGEFIHTNIVGTYNLVEAAREYWVGLKGDKRKTFRFHHVSTDEVYGSLGVSGFFTEESAYCPNSPYSASKAGSDHLARAWHHTYGLPVVVSNCSNNYGPYQYPEKLIPLMILKAISGEDLPVYGKGDNVRDWLYVEDHARALYTVLTRGKVGETYNIGGNNEKTNIDVVNSICGILDRLARLENGNTYASRIRFVKDRPGHDKRYAIDANKIRTELGWRPKETVETGIERTVRWYLDHLDWCGSVRNVHDQGKRIGLGKRG